MTKQNNQESINGGNLKEDNLYIYSRFTSETLDYDKSLLDELKNFKKKESEYKKHKRYAIFIGFIFIFFFIISTSIECYTNSSPLTINCVIFLISGITIICGANIFFSTKDISNKIELSTNELDLRRMKSSDREKRAEKLFKVHQLELQKYYDLILNNNKLVFYLGVFCVIIGFVIMVLTIIFVENENKLKIISGVSSGILSNFVGALYMKMFTKSMESLSDFHNRFVTTNKLHFSNFLISKISNNSLREYAYEKFILNINEVDKNKSTKK